MRNFAKRSLSIFIAVIMLFSIMAVGFSTVSAASYFNGGNTIYLRPSSQWKMNSARFAAYFFTPTANEWVSMKDTDGDGYFEATIPDGYWSNVIFCRMNPEYTDNNWSTETEDRLWTQTENLTCDGVNDCYEITGGTWNEGSWCVYSDKLVYFVNTKNWSKVHSYCVNTSLAGDTWPGKATQLVNAEMGVYSVNPGNYHLIRFTDGTYDGESTSQYNYADVKGKYIDPITGGIYTSAAEALTYANKESVFFVNTQGWKKVNGHGWTDGVGGSTAYPGTAATLVNDEKGVYAFHPGDRKKVLFNDGTENGANTSYYTFTDVKGKYIEPKTGNVYNSAEEAWTAASTNVAYFVNTLGWSKVNGFGWTQGIGSNTAYPGTAATLINSKYSVYSFDPGDRKELLFNDGKVNGSNTSYYTFANVKGKYIEPKTGGVYNSVGEALEAAKFAEPPATQPTAPSTQPPTTEPTNLNVALSGDFNQWSTTEDMFEHYGGYDYHATIIVPAGTYNFKIVHESLWHGNATTIKDSTDSLALSSTGGDCTLKASGGQYDFYYNTSTHNLSILYTEVEIETDEDAPTVVLSGSFNAWSNTEIMTNTHDNVVEKTVKLETGEYYFNIVENGSWYHTGSSISKIVDTISNEPLEVSGGVCIFKATGGEYNFVYDFAKNTLTIEASVTVDPADLVTVSVAGDFNSWDKNANVFKKESKDTVSTTVDLKAGSYYFKIVENDLWYGNNGTIENTTTSTSSAGWEMTMTAGDCVLKASGGSYKFTYKVTSRLLTITYVPSDEDYAETAKVYLAGDFNDWNSTSSLFSYSSKNVVSTSVKLNSGLYYFKLVEGGLWYGNGKTFDNTVSNSQLSSTGGNCVLNATGGTYTFSYNVVDKKLTITYVASEEDFAQTAVVSVAGDFNDWSQTANKMTRYSKNVVVTTFDIKGGTYFFKIVHDGLWYGNNGTIVDTTTTTSNSGWVMSMTASECILKATGGTYTFMYNVVTRALTITAEITAEDPAKTAVVSVAGDFNDWSQTANKLTYSAENTVSTTFDLKAGTYYFKIVHDGLWYGNNGTIVDTTTATSNNGWDMAMTSPECILKATGGTYTFTYNVVTAKLVITANITAEDPAKTAVVSLAGDFNDWSQTANVFKYSEENVVTTSVFLFPGTYKFKIVDGSLWYGNSGTITNTTGLNSATAWEMSPTAVDCTLDLSGGTYTFNYNVVTKKLQVLCKLDDYDPAQYSDVRLVGDFNNWDTEASKMTFVGDRAVLIDVELEAGTYQFKIVEDGVWYGNNGTIVNKTTDSSDIGWTLTEEEGNCTLQTTGGKYTFIYRVVPNTIIIFHNYDHNYLD